MRLIEPCVQRRIGTHPRLGRCPPCAGGHGARGRAPCKDSSSSQRCAATAVQQQECSHVCVQVPGRDGAAHALVVALHVFRLLLEPALEGRLPPVMGQWACLACEGARVASRGTERCLREEARGVYSCPAHLQLMSYQKMLGTTPCFLSSSSATMAYACRSPSNMLRRATRLPWRHTTVPSPAMRYCSSMAHPPPTRTA
jgi:hypothetical protein